MKTIHPRILIVATGLLIAGCSKHETTSTDESGSATPPPAATPAPVKAEVAVATPPPKRLAPEGMFFLLAKKSVETPDGIIGLKPGTQVLQQPDGKFMADGHPIEVLPTEITNDLDIAGRVVGADARAQAMIRQTLQARPASSAPKAPGSSAAAATSNPPPSPAAPRSNTAMQSTSSLGAAHTRVKDGWLWQQNTDGAWVKVRETR